LTGDQFIDLPLKLKPQEPLLLGERMVLVLVEDEVLPCKKLMGSYLAVLRVGCNTNDVENELIHCGLVIPVDENTSMSDRFEFSAPKTEFPNTSDFMDMVKAIEDKHGMMKL
jgi:hypothetical protein